MQIHSRKMNTNKDVNFEELARCTDDFNGAQCKAVCIEAVRRWELKISSSWKTRCFFCFKGMIALRRGAVEVQHEDFMDAILEVQAKKKTNLNYYAWYSQVLFCFLSIVKSILRFHCSLFFFNVTKKINKYIRDSSFSINKTWFLHAWKI